jgi:hypothetical protein
MTEQPRTRFARNGDVHLAYQTRGTGSIDILLIDTWVHHVEAVWDFPDFARFLRRLSSFGRLIHFDRRGTGLSDPVPLDKLPDFQTQMEASWLSSTRTGRRARPSSAPPTARSSRCSWPLLIPSDVDRSCSSHRQPNTNRLRD